MRIVLYPIVALLLINCSTPKAPEGSSVTNEPGEPTLAPKRPELPKERWKVKDAEAAKAFLQSCDPVKEGSLLLTIEQEATPEDPVWLVGLQIKDGPLLDRCTVDAETEKLFCRGDTCP